MKTADILLFKKTVLKYYKAHGRHDLPWRKTRDPYKILVSEIMLQQTQVDRVIPKYLAFLQAFPDVRALAHASFSDVLMLWSGLGYNRRALFLQRAAVRIDTDFSGKFPSDAETLETLPGVGPYTARAVATFSRGASYIFIETNIRRVFIHEFFQHKQKVDDKELLPLLTAVHPKDPDARREWYSALMDYGTYLKATVPNPNKRSVQYVKQSAFSGSIREVRGALLRTFKTEQLKMGKGKGARIARARLLAPYTGADAARAEKALSGLVADGLLVIDVKGYVTIRK